MELENRSTASAQQQPTAVERPRSGDAVPDSHLPLRLLLSFSPARTERRFVEHYVAFYYRYAQASLALGLLLVVGDYLVDRVAQPGLQANVLRLQWALPILALGLGYTFLPAARRHWQPVLAGFIAVVGCCLFWILLRIDSEGGNGLESWVGILNFTFLEFYCFVILGVQFRVALISGLAILAAFEVALCWHPGQSVRDVVYWSYHVVTLFILSAGIGWWREFVLRKEFLTRSALDDARRAAERLARTKGEFLAAMSHEIRTPMNGVLGLNELLLDSELLPQQRAWAESVQASGRHLLAVINDVLDVSKIESGHLTLEAVQFDLADVVEEALVMFAQPAQAKGLELLARFTPPEAELRFLGDPLRLRQVIANLVGNALKFTDRGEVVVHTELVERSGDGAHVRISVQDTGIGIAPDAQGRIFERFSQADQSTTRRYGGTGLGLAICRQLTELMAGQLTVESQPGRGSTFSVDLRLPWAPADSPSAPLPSPLATVNLLVVDDNRVSRDILCQHLQAWRMAVVSVDSGAAALHALTQAAQAGQAFDLAVLDAQMPQMDGLQLAAEIRRQRGLAGTRLIVLGTTHLGSDLHEQGIMGQVGKPVRRGELRRVVGNVLAADALAPSHQRVAPAHAHSLLRGTVLLVEDNPVNQSVAIGMLRKMGLRWQLAENGMVAVQRVCEQDFDLVLMDCQMPVMDGYQATAAIRQLPDGRGANLPIVALTANTGPGEADLCRAAGMSAFLSKPFSQVSLRASLSRWLPAAAPALAPGPQRATEPVIGAAGPPRIDATRQTAGASTERGRPAGSAIDLAVVDTFIELDEEGGPGLLREVFGGFLKTADRGLSQVRVAVTGGEAQALCAAAHALKSSAANVGANTLSDCYRQLERCGREGRIDKALELLARTEHEHARAVAQVQEILMETV